MSISRLGQALLLLIIIACTYYLVSGQESYTQQVAPNQELPQFSGHNVIDDSYDLDGQHSYRITSAYLDHYAERRETVFENIVLYIYSQNNVIEWKIQSDKAVLDREESLTLTGNVEAHNLLPETSFDRMLTDTLTIELLSKDFYTDTPVTLQGPSFENVGQAAKGNFGINEATLFNKVISVYETTP